MCPMSYLMSEILLGNVVLNFISHHLVVSIISPVL